MDETRKAFGRIDILVCNAASNPYFGSQLDISDEAFRKVLDNNIVANNWLIGMVAPEMRARKDGAVIIVSSIGGLRGQTAIGAYGVTKAADMQLARNLAQELGPDNVRVNCIAPGLVKTEFARALWDTPEGEQREASGRSPLRRLERAGRPGGRGGLSGARGRAGLDQPGQTIVVDGGTTC